MYNTTFDVHIDFRERIGANIMCSESVPHMKSVLPYWPSNQNGVSAVVAQIYQPTEAKNRVTNWLWFLVHHLFHVLQDDGSPPDWSKNTPPLCYSLSAVAMWQPATSCENIPCTCERNTNKAESSVGWGGGGGGGGLLVWTMDYRAFQLK